MKIKSASKISNKIQLFAISCIGQIGASILEPVIIHNTTIRFKPLKPVKEIKLLKSGTSLNFKQTNGWVECTVPKVTDFEMMLCLYK